MALNESNPISCSSGFGSDLQTEITVETISNGTHVVLVAEAIERHLSFCAGSPDDIIPFIRSIAIFKARVEAIHLRAVCLLDEAGGAE